MITPLCSQVRCCKLKQLPPASHGGMCERLKQAVLKTAIPERVSGVRIPLPPPLQHREKAWLNSRWQRKLLHRFLHFSLADHWPIQILGFLFHRLAYR